jgi:hypothetical protein
MSERQPNHIPEPQGTPHEGGNGAPSLPIAPQEHPTLPPADGGRTFTSVQPPIFENCIVRDLMPSSERVDEMLAQGLITEEHAVQQKKEALAFERVIQLGERINAIRGQFFSIDNGLSTQEKRHLRAEYKSLRKESRLLKKQLRES